jgi:hypothetical protein
VTRALGVIGLVIEPATNKVLQEIETKKLEEAKGKVGRREKVERYLFTRLGLTRIVLVPKTWMLDISGGLPMTAVALWRSGESIKVEDIQGKEKQGEIKSWVSKAQSLIYSGRFADSEREKEVISHLEDCAARFDLVEAFKK